MSDILRTGFFLFVTCLIAAVCLAVTESITAPRIREQAEKALLAAKKSVLPEAAGFPASLSVTLPADPSEKRDIEIGVDSQGKMVGTVYQVAPKGYAGPINMVVGIKADGTLSGVVIQSMTETPGLGTKLKEDFLVKFLGLMKEKGTKANVKVKQDGGDVDGITAATVSSRAFCRGIREAFDLAKANGEAISAAASGKAGAAPTIDAVPRPQGTAPEPVQNDQSVVSPSASATFTPPPIVPVPSMAPDAMKTIPALPNVPVPGAVAPTPTSIPTPASGGVTP